MRWKSVKTHKQLIVSCLCVLKKYLTLARVSEEFADQRDVQGDRERHLVDRWGNEQLAGKLRRIYIEIFWDALSDVFNALLDNRHLLRFSFDRYSHAWSYKEGTSVDLLAVDEHVTVGNELLGGKDGRGEFHPVDDVV